MGEEGEGEGAGGVGEGTGVASLCLTPFLSASSQDRAELAAGASSSSGDTRAGYGSDGLHELRLNRLHDEPRAAKGRKA